VKPCSRCKQNKQGAYHCRLRRKHREGDWDGKGSSTILLGKYMKEYGTVPVAKVVNIEEALDNVSPQMLTK